MVEQKDAVFAGEKTTIKKVRFLENLSKLFPKAVDFFDNQRIDLDDNPPGITIPSTQTMFKELIGRKNLKS